MTGEQKDRIVAAAKEWAKAERRLRNANVAGPRGEKDAAASDSDITEQTLLRVVEEAEPMEVVTFFGRPIKVGDVVTPELFEWMKMEAKRWWRG